MTTYEFAVLFEIIQKFSMDKIGKEFSYCMRNYDQSSISFPKKTSISSTKSQETKQYTPKQGQYLAYICFYTKINGRPPAEADMQQYFNVSLPSVHQMVVKLESLGLIERKPGVGRSIRVLVDPDKIPRLK